MPLNPEIDPAGFYLPGGNIAVLMLHGFTGAPPEMRKVADYLNQNGLSVVAPLLPGHGTSASDLNKYGWLDWTGAVAAEYDKMRGKYEHIFVAGLSMGALLSLNLTAQQPDISGVITYSAAIDPTDWRRHLPKFLTRILHQLNKPEDVWADPSAQSFLWCYDTYPTRAAIDFLQHISDVIDLLPQITCPLLSVFSTDDPVITAEGVHKIYDQVQSQEKELLSVDGAGHVITLDAGWETIAEKSYSFIQAHTPEGQSEIKN